MIARDPEQRRLYEAQLKAERDARANCDSAREEGLEKGYREGLHAGAVGKVQLLRQLLDLESPTDAEIQGLTMDQLSGLEQDFQQRLRDRN
ncbi:hypothetical protein [Novipirellula sp.]|uniref:hypothetical protein n=1 Tax=Novipirellula sp. TaxID=2795430 RepID=UPI003566564F